MVIPHFLFFSDPLKLVKGNYPAVLKNHKNLHYRHKVFQVAHENRDCTQSKWIIFAVLFYFHRVRKKGERN